MTKPQTRVTREDGTLTNATDENGIPAEPTARDVEVLGAHRHAAYMQRRREKIKERERKAEEDRRYRRFYAEFVRTGRAPGDARSAYADSKRDQATAAARKADVEAHTLHRAETLGAL